MIENFWKTLTSRNAINYFAIGLTGVGLEYVSYYFLYGQGLNFTIASVISSLIAATSNFFVNAHFNFKMKSRLWLRYTSYMTIAIAGAGLGGFVVFLSTNYLQTTPLVAKSISLPAVWILQYLLNVRTTFSPQYETKD